LERYIITINQGIQDPDVRYKFNTVIRRVDRLASYRAPFQTVYLWLYGEPSIPGPPLPLDSEDASVAMLDWVFNHN
jgi:hypothetical protein